MWNWGLAMDTFSYEKVRDLDGAIALLDKIDRVSKFDTVEPRFKGFLGTDYFCLLNPKSLKFNSLFYKGFSLLVINDYQIQSVNTFFSIKYI